MYEAIYLPNDDLSKTGFNSIKDAWDWIDENHICETCREGKINHCSAEWMVDKIIN